MKLLRSHSMWLVGAAGAQLALLAFALSVPDARSAGRSSKAAGYDVQAKLAYCEDCHGRSAQGFHGYFPIPRLAGQQPEYLKNQLEALVEHRRTNNIMFNVAHSLSPGMIAALATDFRALNPPATKAVERGTWCPRAKKYSKTASPKPMLPPAPPATARKPRVAARFRDWRADCPTTSTTN